MDPIVSAVIAAVLWFGLRSVIAVVIFVAFWGVGALIAGALDRVWPAVVGTLLAFVAAGLWELFAVINGVLEVIHILQLGGVLQ